MDFQTVFNALLGVVTVVVAPAVSMLVTRVKSAETAAVAAHSELLQYKTHVAENFTSLRRFEGFEEALFKKLDSIEQKLDGKADK